MTETVFYATAAVTCLVALGNWRSSIYLIILLDILRDPIRKLTPETSIVITLSATVVWGFTLVGSLSSDRSALRLFNDLPKLRNTLQFFALALMPGFVVAVLASSDGWKIGLIGGMTYLAPLIAIPIGYAFTRSPQDVIQLLKFYIIVNSIALIGTPLEYSGVSHITLGGLPDSEWIRHRPGQIINLICGCYRSPDVMGLHAAFVATFSVVVLVQQNQTNKLTWILTAAFASFCVILCGRRKMIGIPLTAFLAIQVFGIKYRNRVPGKLFGSLLAVIGTFAIFVIANPNGLIDSEYTEYATTTVTEAKDRLKSGLISSTIHTYNISGFLGGGLGIATQGKYYVSSTDWRSGQAGYQEDGVSRLLVELGLPGIGLMILAIGSLVSITFSSIRACTSQPRAQTVQIALTGFIIANIASFVVSHQIYSGDPNAVLFVSFCLGIAWSCPRMQTATLDNPTHINPPENYHRGANPFHVRT